MLQKPEFIAFAFCALVFVGMASTFKSPAPTHAPAAQVDVQFERPPAIQPVAKVETLPRPVPKPVYTQRNDPLIYAQPKIARPHDYMPAALMPVEDTVARTRRMNPDSISSQIRDYPNLKPREVAELVGCTPGLVRKIRRDERIRVAAREAEAHKEASLIPQRPKVAHKARRVKAVHKVSTKEFLTPMDIVRRALEGKLYGER